MKNKQTYTHNELVAQIRNRNQQAFSYLYDNYSQALYGVIHAILKDVNESEDVLQKTFLRVWNSFSGYDENKGRLYTWMLNIARNLAIDHTRSKQARYKAKIQSAEENVLKLERRAATDENKSDYIGFDSILDNLKEEHRKVINLAYFEGYTQEEMAQKLNLPLGTVKTKVRQAILKLRELTEKEHLR